MVSSTSNGPTVQPPVRDPHPPVGKSVLVFTVLALLVAFIRYPMLGIGSETLFELDWAIFCKPIAEYNRLKLLNGSVPTWCPLLHNGVPYFAQWNTLLCYPGILLYLLLPTNWGLNLFQLCHMAFGAVGMFLLARRLNGGAFVGAAVIGLSWELNGVCLSLMNWPQNLSNYAWVPWVILLQLRAMSSAVESSSKSGLLSPRPFAAIALAAMATALHLLTGLPEFNVITWTFSLAIGLAQLQGSARLWQLVGAWLAVILLGFAIAAVQIIPSGILAHMNDDPARGSMRPEWALNGSGLINFVHPTYDVLGQHFSDRASTKTWMPAHYSNLGLTALALVMACRLRRQKLVWAIVAVGVVWTILAGGWADPLAGLFIKHIPVVSRMRYPIKFVLGAVLAIHLLAALFWREENRKDLQLGIGLALLLPLGALALGALFRLLSNAPPTSYHLVPLAVHFLFGIGLLLWFAYAPKVFRGPVLTIGAALVLLGNSYFATREINPTATIESYEGMPLREFCQTNEFPVPTGLDGRVYSDLHRGWLETNAVGYVAMRRFLAHGNTALTENINNTAGFFSVYPKWQEVWQISLDVARYKGFTALEEHMLDLTGVTLVPDYSLKSWTRRTNAMPIVTIGQEALVHKNLREFFAVMASTNWNPRTLVGLEKVVQSAPDPAARAKVISFADTAWTIETEAARPTLLVISQTWYPGWSATVNGEAAEILKANLAFQAVVVPGGKALVELRYREPGLRLGAAISATALLGCLAACVRGRRAARTSQPELGGQ